MSMSEDFKAELEKKIASIEERTSVEFVPVVIRQSSDYFKFRLIVSLIVVIIAQALLRFLSHSWPLFLEFVLVCLGGLAFFGLISIPAVLSRLLSADRKHEAVESQAQRIFLSEEIFATRERTGILILLSLFEHSVFILADRGLHHKVEGKEWADLGQRLAADFNRDQPGATFFQALDALIERLHKDFPASPDDNPNELRNQLRAPS